MLADEYNENLGRYPNDSSILVTSLLMWKYRALNKEKEELCIRDGIDDTVSMQDKYRESGDESPLFR